MKNPREDGRSLRRKHAGTGVHDTLAATWVAMRSEYVAGLEPLTMIAKRHGVLYSAAYECIARPGGAHRASTAPGPTDGETVARRIDRIGNEFLRERARNAAFAAITEVLHPSGLASGGKLKRPVTSAESRKLEQVLARLPEHLRAPMRTCAEKIEWSPARLELFLQQVGALDEDAPQESSRDVRSAKVIPLFPR
jgi:hypothetical protein